MFGITNFLSPFYVLKDIDICTRILYLSTYKVGTTEMCFPFFCDKLLQLCFTMSKAAYALFWELVCGQSTTFTICFKATKEHQ